MMTGWGVQIEPQEKEAKGIQWILPKPFNLEQVRAALKGATRLQAQHTGSDRGIT